MSSDLIIVIVNWNVADLLRDCLASIYGSEGARRDDQGELWLGPYGTRIVVVDNASSDDSVEMLRTEFPGVELIESAQNLGFTGGNNLALRRYLGRYVLLLNPDTRVIDDALTAMVDYMEAHPRVGVLGPRLLYGDNSPQSSRRRFPTLMTAFMESTLLHQWFPNNRWARAYHMADTDDDAIQPVDWVVGACMLVRGEAIAQVGLLDEGFFMYSEELDWCRRMANAGWEAIYYPRAVVIHYEGRSSAQVVPARHIRFGNSKVRYYEKHHGSLAATLVRMFLLGTYWYSVAEEGIKWLLGHKRAMRRKRIVAYRQVIASGLRAGQPAPPPATRTTASKPPRRVLLVSGEYPPMEGGVGAFTHLVGAAMARKGAEVHVLTSTKAQGEAIMDGVHRHALITRWSWRALRTPMGRLIDELAPDVINIQYQTAAYGMRPAINLMPLIRRQPPCVVTFHDLLVPYLYPKAGPVRWWVNLALARGCRASIVTNVEDQARLSPYGWIPRLARIPIGSNIPSALPPDYDRAAWRARLGVAPETTLLCYFGFLNTSKGGEELVLALDQVVHDGEDVALLMIGGAVGASDMTNRAYLDQVDHLLAERGLSDRVHWTGFVTEREVSAYFDCADICVLPYRDGVSFRRGSLMAALVHGMPIVTTHPRVSVPEIAHGENLWLVPAFDAPALAEGIEHLCHDAALRQRLGTGARALSAAFDWDHIAADTLALFDEVLDD